MYCIDALLDAFPDARVLQIIRDGRDAVAGMLADPGVLSWFRAGLVDMDAEVPHPLLGVDREGDRAAGRGVGGREMRHALARHHAADGPAPHPAAPSSWSPCGTRT